MLSMRRSCQLALRSSSSVGAYTRGSSRAFSRSCAHARGVLPVFLEPSTPELSALLATFNSKILLPLHLTKEQQKLVYEQESKAKLDAEPVEITLGDVTLPLEHINRNHMPNRWRHLREIMRQSDTAEDWENVLRVLEGFENAPVNVKPQWRENVVRHLHLSGNQHLILKALQRPKATGLRLSDAHVLVQVLRGVHDKAALVDWAEEETTSALRMAKQVVELMDDDEHCGRQSRGDMASEGDWRGKPSVVALPAEMAAVLAQRYGGDVEEVSKFAGRLVNSLKQAEFMTELDAIAARSAQSSSNFPNGSRQLDAATTHCHDLLQLIIIWNALKTSRNVLDTDMPLAEEAQQFEERVEQVVLGGVEAAEKLSTRNGKRMANGYVEHIRDSIERCRQKLEA